MAATMHVVALLADFVEVYPGTQISAKGLVKYSEVLEVYNLEDIERAMNSLLRKCKYFPTVAEICEEIHGKKKYTKENGYI